MEPISTTLILKYVAVSLFLISKAYFASSGKQIKSVSGVKLGILGMKGAGKTRLWSFLKNEPYVEGQTYIESVSKFTYKKSDGQNVEIADGEDIGGGEDLMRSYMQKFLEEKDSIIFVFDLKEYIVNLDYKRRTNSRLDFIHSHKREGVNVCVLMSHTDEIGNLKQVAKAIKVFKEELSSKEYAKTVFNNYAPIDLTNKEQIQKIETKLFPK